MAMITRCERFEMSRTITPSAGPNASTALANNRNAPMVSLCYVQTIRSVALTNKQSVSRLLLRERDAQHNKKHSHSLCSVWARCNSIVCACVCLCVRGAKPQLQVGLIGEVSCLTRLGLAVRAASGVWVLWVDFLTWLRLSFAHQLIFTHTTRRGWRVHQFSLFHKFRFLYALKIIQQFCNEQF
jgi:hypothetical protein